MVWHPSWREWTIIGSVGLLLLVAWLAVACRFLPCCCLYRLLQHRRNKKKVADQIVGKCTESEICEDTESPSRRFALETLPLHTDYNSYGTAGKQHRPQSPRTKVSPDRSSTHSSDSWTSAIADDSDTLSLPGGEPGRGQLALSLRRNTFNAQILLKIHRAHNLWAFTTGGTIQETFCLIHLVHHQDGTDNSMQKQVLPQERHVVYEGRTTSRHKTRHPEFNEEFTLPLTLSEIASRSLVVTVCAYDKKDYLNELGEVHVDFEDIDLMEGETFLRDLDEIVKEERGQLSVSLCYRPTAEKLSLVLLEASALMLPLGETGSITAKIVVMERGKVRLRRKGKQHPASANMSFDKDLVFLDIPQDRLPNIVLLVTLTQFPATDDMSTGKNPMTFGKIIVGLNLGVSANQHWRDMLNNPREPVVHTHIIR